MADIVEVIETRMAEAERQLRAASYREIAIWLWGSEAEYERVKRECEEWNAETRG